MHKALQSKEEGGLSVWEEIKATGQPQQALEHPLMSCVRSDLRCRSLMEPVSEEAVSRT